MKDFSKTPVVVETDFQALGPKRQGKVRDIYDLGDALLLVATDRISAYDVILSEGIPGKGTILTELSTFWFEWLRPMEDIVPHHLKSTDAETYPPSCQPYKAILSGRSMLVQKAEPLPVECIVRGYLSGSGWKEYREHGSLCKLPLPPGLVESSRLPEPIFTPSTKATHGHDVNISFEQMEKTVGENLAQQARTASLKIYQHAAAYAEARGIIIADTKFEFGIDPESNHLVLIDEVLTPDSSRFWPKIEYAPGHSQPSFDKQYVRDFLDSTGWDHKPPAPRLPPEVIQKTAEKYLEALTRIKGS